MYLSTHAVMCRGFAPNSLYHAALHKYQEACLGAVQSALMLASGFLLANARDVTICGCAQAGSHHLPDVAEKLAIVLLQDTARSFAGTHDGKKKFELYMEATHFDETVANLNAAEHHVFGMRDILLRQSEHVKVIHASCWVWRDA